VKLTLTVQEISTVLYTYSDIYVTVMKVAIFLFQPGSWPLHSIDYLSLRPVAALGGRTCVCMKLTLTTVLGSLGCKHSALSPSYITIQNHREKNTIKPQAVIVPYWLFVSVPSSSSDGGADSDSEPLEEEPELLPLDDSAVIAAAAFGAAAFFFGFAFALPDAVH